MSLFDLEETPEPKRETKTSASAGLVTANIDGGSRGNPGPAGYGAMLRDADGKTVAELSEYLGHKTNNHAEYSALLGTLRYAVEHGIKRLKVISDSELMVKHMKRIYRVNSPDLKPLYEEAQKLAAMLDYFKIEHVLREYNRAADHLANQAMDRGTGKAPAKPKPEKPSSAIPEWKEFSGVVREDGLVELTNGKLPEGTKVRVKVE